MDTATYTATNTYIYTLNSLEIDDTIDFSKITKLDLSGRWGGWEINGGCELPDLSKINYANITCLDISVRFLHQLPDLSKFINLKELDCCFNALTHLDNLPLPLEILRCSNNNLTNIDNLPPHLKILECDCNPITSLDCLPSPLLILCCNGCKLTHLDNLPLLMKSVDCSANFITNLDNLPKPLEILKCSRNKLTSLDCLPPYLQILVCMYNSITSLHNLPRPLKELTCYWNQITSITFNHGLQKIQFRKNPIYELDSLHNLYNLLDNIPPTLKSIHDDSLEERQKLTCPINPYAW
jgi:Leucine-rich repeat (LRR) protein